MSLEKWRLAEGSILCRMDGFQCSTSCPEIKWGSKPANRFSPLIISTLRDGTPEGSGETNMSIMPQIAAMLLKEHRHRAIEGDILLIGRQTVLLTVNEARGLMEREGVEIRDGFVLEIDRSTVGNEVGEYLTDRSFFSMFCGGRVLALDVSDYEGAEVVHDLNVELPERYCGVADFIFNGSCLDNLFDPAMAIKSMSRMLRVGGRILMFEHGTPIQSAFLCYSPEWFFDYFAINDYADCQIFVCVFERSMQDSWTAFRWLPFYEEEGKLKATPLNVGAGDFVSVVVAEKGDNSSDIRTPIQSHYRSFQDDPLSKIYIAKFEEFSRTKRNFSFAAISAAPTQVPALSGSLSESEDRAAIVQTKGVVPVGILEALLPLR